MLLDYGTLLSPSPIRLSIGTIRKPKLIEISELTFKEFANYEVFLKLTPELYYTKINTEGAEYWENLPDDKKEEMNIYQILLERDDVKNAYLEILNFFFEEYIIFEEGVFFVLREKVSLSELSPEHIRGIINEGTFMQVLEILQQICCIYDAEENIDDMKFKNNAARRIFEKIAKAKKEKNKRSKNDKNMELPNIISSVSTMHPSINLVNIWELTIYQLYDKFKKLQINEFYRIDRTRVSVWGDEKKTFDSSLWYKNHFD